MNAMDKAAATEGGLAALDFAAKHAALIATEGDNVGSEFDDAETLHAFCWRDGVVAVIVVALVATVSAIWPLPLWGGK